MASDSFNTLGGYTVGIPPVVVIDSNGNITSNKANIGNLVASIITSSGNVTAPYFIGNVVGMFPVTLLFQVQTQQYYSIIKVMPVQVMRFDSIVLQT